MDIESELWLLWRWGNMHQRYTESNESDYAEEMRDRRDDIICGIINYVNELINDRMDLGHLVEELQLKLAKEE